MSAIVAALGVIAATAVIFAYVVFIWWLDRYEREPLWMVGLVFAWGALGGTCFGIALSIAPSALAMELLGPDVGNVVSTVIVAPTIEEFTKGLVFIILVATLHFDNVTDGLIYGAAAGLGFACLENLLYFVGAENMTSLWVMIILRTLFTALVHCISSAMLGMSIGWARYRTKAPFGAAFVVFVGYVLAVVNHACWNAAATFSGLSQDASGALIILGGIVIVIAASAVMFGLTQWSLWSEHKAIRRFLLEEAERGTLPAEHADIVPYWLRRRKKDWLAAGVPHGDYVEAATLLAFRQRQLEAARGNRAEKYGEEVEHYRRKVKELLGQGRA